MTNRTLLAGLTALAVMGTGIAATAQDLPAPVQARQGQFQMLALNIGVLANMARGNTEYDATAASTAAGLPKWRNRASKLASERPGTLCKTRHSSLSGSFIAIILDHAIENWGRLSGRPAGAPLPVASPTS